MEFFEKYLISFEKYIKNDREEIIYNLCSQYREIQLLPENSESLEKISRRLEMFHVNIDTIENIKKPYSTFKYCGNSIEITLKQAYWDYIKESETGIKDVVRHFSEEFISLNAKILPHRQDLQNYVREYLDHQLINQMIDQNIYTFDNFYSLVLTITDHIKLIDSEYGKKELEMWLENFSEIATFNRNIKDLLFIVLRDLLNKMENILYIIQKID